jgi:hypothetical protein
MAVTPSGAASNVLLMFDPPGGSMRRLGFDVHRLTYLVYELNREQRAWQFEVSFDPFGESLVPAGSVRCDPDRRRLLCVTQAFNRELKRGDRPLILLTHQAFESPTGRDRSYYWLHGGPASVISATDWIYAEPDIYEYLVYSIIVQSILIHLDTQCPDFRPGPAADGAMRGDMFEPQTGRELMQLSVMAAHLSRDLEESLFNCFGPAYAADASRLLSLEWLHDERVQENVEDVGKRVPPPTPSASP